MGVGIYLIASSLAGSGSTSLSVNLCPMKVTKGDLNWIFLQTVGDPACCTFQVGLWDFSHNPGQLPLFNCHIRRHWYLGQCLLLLPNHLEIDVPLFYTLRVQRLCQMASWCNSSDRLAREMWWVRMILHPTQWCGMPAGREECWKLLHWLEVSSIGGMDRSILFIYANRFKGIETGF